MFFIIERTKRENKTYKLKSEIRGLKAWLK